MSSHDPYPWTPNDDDAHDLHAPTIAMPAFEPCDETVPTNAAEFEALLAGDRDATVQRTAPTVPDVAVPRLALDARSTPAARLPTPRTPPRPETDISQAERGLTRCLRVAIAFVPIMSVCIGIGLVLVLTAQAVAAAHVLVTTMLVGLAVLWARGVSTWRRGLPEATDAQRVATRAHWLTWLGTGCLAMASLLALAAMLSREKSLFFVAIGLLALANLSWPLGHWMFLVSWRRMARWLDAPGAQRRTRVLVWLMGFTLAGSMLVNSLSGTSVLIADRSTVKVLGLTTTVAGLVLLPVALAAIVWWFLALVALRRAMRARGASAMAS